jgi:ParB family chromosome partitioning protein
MADESSERKSTQRRGLGRGLAALIVNTDPERDVAAADDASETTAEGGAVSIPVEAISPNPRQPRAKFDEESLAELAASIREHGIIQPLIVTRNPEQSGHYWLIAGERRLRAAQMAELEDAPCIVREASEQELLELALVENIQRSDLNPLEEAAAYQMLIDRFSLTQELIAKRVARSRSAVANTVRLLQLPGEVQQALIDGEISAGHARALLGLADEETMIAALQRVLERSLNVRQTESLVKQLLQVPSEPTPETEAAPLDAHLQHVENRFRDALGTRVSLNRNRDGSGRLIVHFYSDEDLDSLSQIITDEDDF